MKTSVKIQHEGYVIQVDDRPVELMFHLDNPQDREVMRQIMRRLQSIRYQLQIAQIDSLARRSEGLMHGPDLLIVTVGSSFSPGIITSMVECQEIFFILSQRLSEWQFRQTARMDFKDVAYRSEAMQRYNADWLLALIESKDVPVVQRLAGLNALQKQTFTTSQEIEAVIDRLRTVNTLSKLLRDEIHATVIALEDDERELIQAERLYREKHR